MQHTTGVAVVTTQLADTDRRALSQAWYSALHLADRPSAGRPARMAPDPNAASPNRSRFARTSSGPQEHRPPDGAAHGRDVARSASARCDTNYAAERRVPKTELVRHIERGLARRSPRCAAASFAVRGSDGRVHLIVRTDGTRTRVVAVCAPALRERVERALAQARFALAGCGVRTEVA